MMACFEVSPPKRYKLDKQDSQEEPEVLILAPFKPVPKLIFHSVKLNSSSRKLLIIRNASKSTVFVELPTLPSEDRGFEFSFTEVELRAEEEAILEIVWTPTEVGSWRESVPVRTTSKLRSEFVLISSSIDPKPKKVVRRPVAPKSVAKPTVLAKKLSLGKTSKNSPKQPSVSSSLVKQQVRVARSLPRSSGAASSSPCRRQTFLVNPDNKENSPEYIQPTESRKLPQKNKHDISRRFEDFVLSPLTTNSHLNQVKSNALDDFVMSPLVLHPQPPTKPSYDFVDGTALPPTSVLVAIHEDFQRNSQATIRRETFEVPNHLHPVGIKRERLTETYVEENEFEDSLEEAHSEDAFVHQSSKISLDVQPSEVQNFASQPTIVVTNCPESFMNSTLKFDLPLPSEDPRRCSTGVKNLSPKTSTAANPKVRKDLFDQMSSPQNVRTNSGIDCAALQLNVSAPFECLSGGLPELNENRSHDRLSTETYVKDRLSTSTYIKDRLSTETYVKEQHSRGSVSAHEDSNDSVFLHDQAQQGNANASSFSCSPRTDDQLRHAKLLSIQEEDFPTPNICEKESKKSKNTAFTIEFPMPADIATSNDSSVVPSFDRPKVPNKSGASPRRKLLRISPATRAKLVPSKPPTAKVERRQTISGALPRHGDRKESQSSAGKSCARPSLTSRLPEARLSLSRAPRLSESHLSLPKGPRRPDARLSLSKAPKQDAPLFKIPRGSKRIAQRMAEKSEPLHCLDDILAEVTNVDPFAASTSSDPFLNRAIYNDSAWIARQESDMIRWLNALLTPPAQLETTDLPSIDIGDLWQKTCRLKENCPAPSREAVSSNLYDENARLNTLRKSAMAFIRSRDIASVLQKISVKVDQRVLSVREDRDLHLDVGLQQLVLELLLCYNPLWLRIGLEAVYGRTVPLRSNSDYIGLTAFLIHNLLSDDNIVATFSHPTVPHLKLPGFQIEMKKFTLKKFLFIVFFLDRAKTAKLIRHDPCLFTRSAKYKESKDIVAAFARDLLAGMGDISRYLGALDCRLTVKQTFLDEFEYAVKDLLDLRDGVRLVRVMELITNSETLHDKLRVPAISRLQKIHNVDLALNALKAAGYEVCGGIASKDIADGHREKTLSLLWQIIYKFQAPRFTAAAEVLQRWWRRDALRRAIDSRIRARKRARREAATVVIQTAWRAVLARRRVAVLREQRAREEAARWHAAVVLQKHWRRHSAEAALARARRAASSIAAWYRGAVVTRRLRQDFLQRRAAAVKLQAHWKGVQTRKRFAQLRRTAAALRIQTWVRRRLAARRFLAAVSLVRGWEAERRRRLEACRRLQSAARAWMAMRRDRARFSALRLAVVVVQRRWRAQRNMQEQRQRFLQLRAAVLAVQRRWRGRRAMQADLLAFAAKRRAAVAIQCWYRARRDRRRFLALRAATLKVQKHWRSRRLTQELRVSFICQRRASRVLQSAIRAWLVGREGRARYLRLRATVVTIQRRVRARALLRDLQCSRRQAAATLIQRRWRSVLAMKGAREEFTALRSAAVVLQRRYRARQAMKTAREGYQRLLSATLVLQARFRARKEMQQLRHRYLSMLTAATTIQHRWRARQAMKVQLQAYSALRNAVRVVQTRYRAVRAMKSTRSQYMCIRNAAIVIQRRFRAMHQMRIDRARYLNLRKSAVIIQQRWRAQLAMDLQRAFFISLRQAALVVQLRYRALLTMRLEHNSFIKLRSSVIFVQRRFRANKLMKEQRQKYLKLLGTTLIVQRHWRAKCAMISEQTKFQTLRHAAITVQKHWRAVILMRQEFQSFQSTRTAAVTIQNWWRSIFLSRKQRSQYLLMQSSAKIIQNHWRMRKLVAQQRNAYLVKKSAVIVLQKFTRGFLARKKVKQELKDRAACQILHHHSARVIQRSWRNYCAMKNELALKICAATKIQALYRGYQSRKRYKEETRKIKAKIEELNANASESEPQCMRERISILCCDFSSETVGGLVMILNALNTICMMAPVLSEQMVAHDIVPKLFSVLCNVNRGVADMTAAKMASKVLLNLCKYEKTSAHVWSDGCHLHLYPHLMKKWISVEEAVLRHFVTMLWHFSQDPEKAKIISADEKLKSTLLFCINKFKSKKSKSSNCSLPSLHPNWGLLRKETRPFAFEDVLYGLRAVCYKLKVNMNM